MRRHDPTLDPLILDLSADGLSVRGIAAEVGVSSSAVQRVLTAMRSRRAAEPAGQATGPSVPKATGAGGGAAAARSAVRPMTEADHAAMDAASRRVPAERRVW